MVLLLVIILCIFYPPQALFSISRSLYSTLIVFLIDLFRRNPSKEPHSTQEGARMLGSIDSPLDDGVVVAGILGSCWG